MIRSLRANLPPRGWDMDRTKHATTGATALFVLSTGRAESSPPSKSLSDLAQVSRAEREAAYGGGG